MRRRSGLEREAQELEPVRARRPQPAVVQVALRLPQPPPGAAASPVARCRAWPAPRADTSVRRVSPATLCAQQRDRRPSVPESFASPRISVNLERAHGARARCGRPHVDPKEARAAAKGPRRATRCGNCCDAGSVLYGSAVARPAPFEAFFRNKTPDACFVLKPSFMCRKSSCAPTAAGSACVRRPAVRPQNNACFTSVLWLIVGCAGAVDVAGLGNRDSRRSNASVSGLPSSFASLGHPCVASIASGRC